MRNKLHPFSKIFNSISLLLLTAWVMAGCAMPASVEGMQVAPSAQLGIIDENSPLKNQIIVDEVTGGRYTDPLAIPEVSNRDFEKALELSLTDAGLGTLQQDGRYKLIANILSLQKPIFAAAFTVNTSVRYRLVEREQNVIVAERDINTSYTGGAFDSFLGVERLKMANEGAMRENITGLIRWLYSLEVDDLTN